MYIYSRGCFFVKGTPGNLPYSVSKAAVMGLAKSTGKEYCETGITVNALCPAVIRTKMANEEV